MSKSFGMVSVIVECLSVPGGVAVLVFIRWFTPIKGMTVSIASYG